MNPFLTLPFRYLLGRKLRTGLTTLAVVFGVAVIFSVNILLPTIVAALNSSALGVPGQVDVTVSGATGETFGLDAVRLAGATDGVAAVAPALRREAALADGTSFDLIGLDPASAPLVRAYPLSAGRFLAPTDGQAAVLSQSLARALGLHPGSVLHLPTPQGLVDLPVVGIVATPAGNQVLVPLSTAQALFAAADRINTLDIALRPGADRDAVVAALQRGLGSGYRVGGTALASDTFATIQIGEVAFNVLALLTLFMGAFLIFNTFRTVVVERRADIGMLRAMGATRRTIVALILIESLAQGAVGTAGGLLLGYGLALAMSSALQAALAYFARLRVDRVVVTWEAFVLAGGLGIGMTILAGLLPALSASRVSVLAALQAQSPAPASRRLGPSTYLGAGLLLLALLTFVSGNAGLLGVGAILFLGGLVALVPALLGPIARAVDPLLQRAFAREGLIAAANLRRRPDRTAVTVSALMIGLAIVIALNSIFASVESAYSNYVQQSYSADILLLPSTLALWSVNVGVGEDFERELAAIPGIGGWASLRYASAQVDGAAAQVLALDPRAYPQVATLVFDQGSPATYTALESGRTAVANPLIASALNLRVGDMLAVQTVEGPRFYRLVGIGGDYLSAKINTIYISQETMTTDFHNNEDVLLLANLAPHADRAAVSAAVGRLLARYPQLTLTWGEDWRAAQLGLLKQIFLVIYGVLLVFIIPALLGLLNTLAINVLERTREIGVLRAIGATRAQVHRLVLAEALLLSAAGAILGLLAGLTLGYALTVLTAAVFTHLVVYSFPLAGTLLALAAALGMAVLASLLPGRQAARLGIVQALQYE